MPSDLFGGYRIPAKGELKVMRRVLRVEQKTVADAAGISQATAAKLEQDPESCQVRSLRKYMAALRAVSEVKDGG